MSNFCSKKYLNLTQRGIIFSEKNKKFRLFISMIMLTRSSEEIFHSSRYTYLIYLVNKVLLNMRIHTTNCIIPEPESWYFP